MEVWYSNFSNVPPLLVSSSHIFKSSHIPKSSHILSSDLPLANLKPAIQPVVSFPHITFHYTLLKSSFRWIFHSLSETTHKVKREILTGCFIYNATPRKRDSYYCCFCSSESPLCHGVGPYYGVSPFYSVCCVMVLAGVMSPLRGSHSLSAQRGDRRSQGGLQRENRAPEEPH